MTKPWTWRLPSIAAAACIGVAGSDVALGHLYGLGLLPIAAVNVVVSHVNYGRAHKPEPPHRPDYAKIRRLELDLGLRDPDPVPIQPNPGSIFGGVYVPPKVVRPGDTPKYQRVVPPAVTSVNEWAYCPVCTRRHAGRCAG